MRNRRNHSLWLAVWSLVLAACTSEMALPGAPPDANRPGTVTGRIVVAVPGVSARQPVAGASVLLLRSDRVAITDADGRFTLSPLTQPGSVLLVRWDSDGDGAFEHQRLINVDPLGGGPGHDLALGDVALSENGVVRGRVLLSDVLPAKGGHGGTSVFVPEGPFIAYTGDDGAFVLPELPEGELTFGIFHPGHVPQSIDRVDLRGGESITLRDVTLAPASGASSPGTLSGRVVASPATDLTRIKGESRTIDGATPLPVAADGTFSAPVPAGLHVVTFSLDAYGTAQVANVLVLPGAARELAPVTLSKDGWVPPAPPDGGTPEDAGAEPTWDAPTARVAGPGAVGAKGRIELDGTLSTAPFAPAGTFLSYRWRQVAGDDVSGSFSTNDSVLAGRLSAIAPETPQKLVFALDVTDTRTGLVGSGTVEVEVVAPPVAVVTPADVLVHPGATFTVDALQSTDPSGAALAFHWRSLDGITISAADAGKSQLTLTAPTEAGTYGIELAVSNGFVSSAPVLATVTVDTTTSPPTVDAGADRVVAAGSLVRLAAAARSADPLTYAWLQLSGPTVNLSGAATAHPTFTAPASFARLSFRVTVDNGAGTAFDDVALEVQDLTPPRVIATDPVAAGASSGGFRLSATFDEPLEPASVTESSVLVRAAGNPVPASVRLENGTKVVLVPRQPLPQGTGYEFVLGNVRDASPNGNVHAPETLTFNVRAPLFTTWTNPLVSKTAPHPGVASNGRETFVFAEYSASTEYSVGIWKPGANGVLEVSRAVDGSHPWYVVTGKRGYVTGGGAIYGIGSYTGYSYGGWWYGRTQGGWSSFGPGYATPFAGASSMFVLYESYGYHLTVLNPANNTFTGDEMVTESTCCGNPQGVSFERAAGAQLADGRLFAVGVSPWQNSTARYLLPYVKGASGWGHMTGTLANSSLAIGSTIMPRVAALGDAPFVAWTDVEGAPKFAGAVYVGDAWATFPDLGPRGVAQAFDVASRGDSGWIAYATGNGLFLRRIDLDGNAPKITDVPGPDGDGHSVDPACTPDHPELSATEDGVWMTWSERCADDAYKVYLRKLE